MVGNTLALKLKLAPTQEQEKLLDEAFQKWASLCNRVSRGEERKSLVPKPSRDALQFSKTQLHQVAKDVKGHTEALKEQVKRVEREAFLGRLQSVENKLGNCNIVIVPDDQRPALLQSVENKLGNCNLIFSSIFSASIKVAERRKQTRKLQRRSEAHEALVFFVPRLHLLFR